MPSTNFARLARIAETTKGVTPAASAFAYAAFTGEGLKPSDPFGRSETITGLRGISSHERLGKAVTGSIGVEQAIGWSDWLYEMALFDRFAAGVEAYNVTADSAISDVASATQTITAAGAWVERMLILLEGLLATKTVIRAEAGTGAGTIIAPGGTFAADIAAPGVGARALFVGVEGAAGDLVTAADGITSTALDFTAFPIPERVGVKIAGSGDARNNVFATVVSVAANKLTLGDLPADWQTGLGAGQTIQIYVGELIEDGDTVLTESHEKWNTKTSPVAYELFKGVAVNSLSVPHELNAIIRPQAQLIGFEAGISETASGASYADPASGVSKKPMRTGSTIARLAEGGVADANISCTQSLNLTINNNLTPVGCLAHDAAVDYNEGDFEVVIEGRWRYRDKALLDKYFAQTATKHLIAVARDNQAMLTKIYAGVYTDGGATVGGRNQEHTVNMRFEAQADPVHGKVIGVTRFRYYA